MLGKFLKLAVAVGTGLIMSTASAQYRMVVPQEPGGGTSVWASIVAKHLEKHLGEQIVILHQPGARDIPGFNRFHNQLRKDPKTIMVSHGGNAESYLVEPVDYNYYDYEPIGAQNLTIVTAHRADFDPYAPGAEIRFAAGSGQNPDMMAFTLLVCGELPTMPAYLDCYTQHANYVKGMRAGERRLSYMRGELNTTRESAAAYLRHVQPGVDAGDYQLWFSHGILDLSTGQVVADPNFPAAGSFQAVYRARWDKEPAGPLYNAYLLAKQYRDVLQKALWMDRGNPNAAAVKRALVAMINDPVAMSELRRDTGDYAWMVGVELHDALGILNNLTTAQALQDLVWWNQTAFGTNAVYKPEIVKQ